MPPRPGSPFPLAPGPGRNHRSARQLRPSGEGRAAVDGNRWCESPDGLPMLLRLIAGVAALKAESKKSPDLVEWLG
jgi:hypothetical protein